jgi:hypothetical protein
MQFARMHQSAYCEQVLKTRKKKGFWEYVKSAKTPEIPGERLSIADSPEIADPGLQRRHRAIVGALGWPQQGARFSARIATTVGSSAGRMSLSAEHVLKYLSGTYADGILYEKKFEH